jgi:RAB protein geranylgeranyltransferase component A
VLQFGVGYGYHEPLKGISKGFCRSCGVVGHGAKLTLFMPKIGNDWELGNRPIKKNKKNLTQEVAKGKTGCIFDLQTNH